MTYLYAYHQCSVCGSSFRRPVVISADCDIDDHVIEACETCDYCRRWAALEVFAHYLRTNLSPNVESRRPVEVLA